MRYFIIVACIVFLSGCGNKSTTETYVPQPEDTISNDKNNWGLKGKVKTMDIYYFSVKSETSLFSPSFKKGDKSDYEGIHHLQLVFDINGNLLQQNQYTTDRVLICKVGYEYGDWGHTRTEMIPATNTDELQIITYKYNKYGQLLDEVCRYGDGRVEERGLNTYDEDGRLLKYLERRTGSGGIHTYDKKGNLVRTELLTKSEAHAFALTEYDYNNKNLLTEKREYYNKVDLYRRYIYTYNDKDLLVDEKTYQIWVSEKIPERHYTYQYNNEGRLSSKYEVDKEGNSELIAEYEYRYYPDSTLHYVLKNSKVVEEYDTKGTLIVNREAFPGFEIIEEDIDKYKYDHCGNWTEIKKFEDFVQLGMGRPSGLVQVIRPYVERHFIYYE